MNIFCFDLQKKNTFEHQKFDFFNKICDMWKKCYEAELFT